MKRLALILMSFLVIELSVSFANELCEPLDQARIQKSIDETTLEVYKRTGVDLSKQVYGDILSEHFEYDIIHKEGSK